MTYLVSAYGYRFNVEAAAFDFVGAEVEACKERGLDVIKRRLGRMSAMRVAAIFGAAAQDHRWGNDPATCALERLEAAAGAAATRTDDVIFSISAERGGK